MTKNSGKEQSLPVKSTVSKSPTRVDFSGGTIDLWPLSVLVPRALTINCSIDCYTVCEFNPQKEFIVTVKSPDFRESFTFKDFKSFYESQDEKLSLLKEVFKEFKKDQEFCGHWSLISESPAGSGLGGSSSLLISILKTVLKILNKETSKTELVDLAKNIETRVLKSPAGIQDYLSPIQNGINKLTFNAKGFVWESLPESVLSFWQDKFVLIDSKIKHHSGMNNWEVLKGFIHQDEQVVFAVNEIAENSWSTLEALKNKNVSKLKECFSRELEARKKISALYISKELQDFLNKLNKFCSSYKVCGAGGGGCVLVLIENKEQKLKLEEFSTLPFTLIGE